MPAGRPITVAKFLEDWYAAVEPSLRPTTYRRYGFDVRRITARLGRYRLTDLTPQIVQRFIVDLHAEGLSARSVGHCRRVLCVALNQAENWNLLARNPAAGKRARLPRVQPRDVPALTPETAQATVAAFAGHALEALVITAMITGLREGELLGLHWEDVDLDKGTITVRQQLQRIAGERVLTEPKSRMGRRVLPVPAFVVEALRRQKVRQLEDRIKARRWEDSGHVFTSAVGTPLEASNTVHRFQKRLAAAGLPRMTVHDLRHAAASLMEAMGIPPRTRMEYLGHSQIALTLGTYTHSNPELMREVAKA
jgi:integrase